MTDTEAKALRTLIDRFLEERAQVKLEKLEPDDPKWSDLQNQYQRETWVADAARRVTQLQIVTHSLKPIHPDAKGTNLYRPPAELPNRPEIGSHLLGSDFSEDVVGNAAALDVYKFLKLELDGKTLLSRVLAGDEQLVAAFSDDVDKGREWMQAFAGIAQPRGAEASHTRAKQLYWLAGEDPTEDTDFHLLAPLYATSLAHRVYQTINEHRFSEDAKAARQARREKAYSNTGFHEYPGLAMQKLGGTKPQNISQLNSERRGENFLLASLPPNWVSHDVRAPLYIESVFQRSFGYRPGVRQTVAALRRFLASDPPANVETRNKRDEFLNALIDEVLLFAGELHTLEPGWSALPECRLNEAESLWLDPGRCETDADFSKRRENGDWIDKVGHRFANWVNGRLDRQLPVGDPEHHHWMDSLCEVLPHA